jgi:hypothetical protein
LSVQNAFVNIQVTKEPIYQQVTFYGKHYLTAPGTIPPPSVTYTEIMPTGEDLFYTEYLGTDLMAAAVFKTSPEFLKQAAIMFSTEGVGSLIRIAKFCKFLNAAKSETSAFDDLMAQVRAADFSTPRNGAVFWTGYSQGNQAAAMSWAEANGKFTMEMTSGGKWLNNLNLYGPNSPVTSTEAKALWNVASEKFASGASGSVNAFTRGTTFNPNSAFYNIELPILQGRKIIYRGY